MLSYQSWWLMGKSGQGYQSIRSWREAEEQRREKRMLDKIKNLNIERLDIEEGMALAAFGRIVENEYALLSNEAPDWLTDNLKVLRKEIRQRLQDTLESRLVEITSRLDSLSTVEEKREKLKAEAARLKEKLGASA